MDILKLVVVYRLMTIMSQEIRNLTYKDKLKPSLERRRVRKDLIEVFKWVKDFNRGNMNKVFIVKKQVRTRANGFKLHKFKLRKEIEKKVVN